MNSKHKLAWLGMALTVVAGAALAQRFRGGGEWSQIPQSVRTAREVESHSTGTPDWTNAPGFERDVFTFVRLRYQSNGRWGRGGCGTDFPDSDLNLSYRLQQMTSLKVSPDGRVLNITDPELFEYPWVYMVEVGALELTEEEVPILRRYLLNGGFLMVDDFWGESEWANFERQMKRVLPEKQFTELSLDHPLYHCVFEIKEKGQVPNVYTGTRSEETGITWERSDAKEVHHRAWFDDQGRMMIIATHNTDNGDGWEREGENHYFFKNFSEKISYPLGINIIFYTMTH